MAEAKSKKNGAGRKALDKSQKDLLANLGATLSSVGSGRTASAETIATRDLVQSKAGKATAAKPVVFVPAGKVWNAKGTTVEVPSKGSTLRDALADFAAENKGVKFFAANGCYIVHN